MIELSPTCAYCKMLFPNEQPIGSLCWACQQLKDRGILPDRAASGKPTTADGSRPSSEFNIAIEDMRQVIESPEDVLAAKLATASEDRLRQLSEFRQEAEKAIQDAERVVDAAIGRMNNPAIAQQTLGGGPITQINNVKMRDWFAMHVLPYFLDHYKTSENGAINITKAALASYAVADTMMVVKDQMRIESNGSENMPALQEN